jgi:hypothetical protein
MYLPVLDTSKNIYLKINSLCFLKYCNSPWNVICNRDIERGKIHEIT